RDATGHVAGQIATGFPPVALQRFSRGFGIAVDVELEAFAGADDRLVERRAVLGLHVFRAAADRLATAVRSDNLAAAAPLAGEFLERTARQGLGLGRGED